MDNKSTKVLLISPLPPPLGGISSWTERYIEWCNLQKISIEVVNSAVIGGRVDKINSKISIIDEMNRTVKILNMLYSKIKKHKPKIVHLNSSCGKFGIFRDYLVAIISKLFKIPLIVHFHCNIKDQVSDKFSKLILKLLVRLGNYIFVLNSDSYNFIKDMCKSNLKIIPNFIDYNWINNGGKIINKKVEKIAYIGHIRTEKGIEDIINVSKCFPKIEFILAGKMMLDNNIINYNNVKFIGEIDSDLVKELLDSCDIFLFPSKSEGFSISLLEAMARGLPIITTPVGASADMIEDNGGIIVNIGNVDDIASAINKLKNRDEREKMSKWNIEKVERKYSTNRVLEIINEVYEEISC